MNTISHIRKRKSYKYVAVFVAINFLSQIIAPSMAYALTSGPSQPEVQSFEPVSTSQMVDLFTGDFTYNIPLFELPGPNGGYPFNLAYHSGIGMDQEASWVGLGWNLNPGALTRNMRGVPDDFKGDRIEYESYKKDNKTIGGRISKVIELWGAPKNKGGISPNLSVYHNSYRGWGYSVGMGVFTPASDAGFKGGVGASFDSQGGFSSYVSLDKTFGKNKSLEPNANVGVGFHSHSGLSLSMSIGMDRNSGKYKKMIKATGGGGSATLSTATRAFSPNVSQAMENRNLDISVTFGTDNLGILGGVGVKGFSNIQRIANNQFSKSAYGYNYLEYSKSESLLDYNRENDDIVYPESPSLAVPNSTPDFYQVSGQGIGGMFRGYRTDVGAYHDPYTESSIKGKSFGLEIGPGSTSEIGASYTSLQGFSKSGMWNDDLNELDDKYGFKGKSSSNADYEPVYYKIAGEHTSTFVNEMDWIGGEQAVVPKISAEGNHKRRINDDGLYNTVGTNLASSNAGSRLIANNKEVRVKRNTFIHPYTNEDILDANGNEVTSIFDVEFYDESVGGAFKTAVDYIFNEPIKQDFDRTKLKEHHFTGFVVNQSGGSRYVYGIPAMNNSQEETVFSVGKEITGCTSLVETPVSGNALDYENEATDQFKSVTKTPEYAHSYLLTSVLGADYVDSDDIKGPSDGDHGYWVKFTYNKVHEDYDWRAPYAGVKAIKGSEAKFSDNKGAFTHGKKEIWYLATVESSTHIAVFELSDRVDGLSSAGYLASYNGTSIDRGQQKLRKINKIKLYSKVGLNQSSTPIQTVHFEYDYSLCKNVKNNDGQTLDTYTKYTSGSGVNEGGKLTLKKVYMTFENNDRGRLSPYEFSYNSSNPDYNENSYDRWGNYKKLIDPNNECINLDIPYTSQFNADSTQSTVVKERFKKRTDENASAWHLTEITTPTGGTIQINYESDDYAFVQHREAAQMFKVTKLAGAGNYERTYSDPNSDSEAKVYFKLETPIPTTISAQDAKAMVYEHYLKPLERTIPNQNNLQVYFKTKSKLRNGVYQDIGGYADVKNNGWGINTTTTQVNINGSNVDCYTEGYIELEMLTYDNKSYHPFAIEAFQYVRNVEPYLLEHFDDIKHKAGSSDYDEALKVKSLLSFGPTILNMFRNFRETCVKNEIGKYIDRDFSFIRLATPDGVKYGGGVRVQRIQFKDNFSFGTQEASYGQVYDYTKVENGRTISSGVASYEPQIGGEENALKYARYWSQNVQQRAQNSFYTEYPLNESQYPGPSIGYSKVTVMSLNTYNALNASGNHGDPTGVSVNEFYTAREFPTMAEQTLAKGRVKNPRIFIPIPIIGSIETNRMYAAQGFAIQKNDMHGKPKMVSNYGINSSNQVNYDIEVSKVQYLYKSTTKDYDGRVVSKLDNKVKAVEFRTWDGEIQHNIVDKLFGVEYEFFTDQRANVSYSLSTGIEANVVIVTAFPVPLPWPSYTEKVTDLKMFTTNKIVHRSGILETVIATDGQSVVTTTNKGFDPITGVPIYTETQNNWNNPVYNLKDMVNYPSYINEGVTMSVSAIEQHPYKTDSKFDYLPNKDILYQITTSKSYLYPGDEVVLKVKKTNGDIKKYVATVVYDAQYANYSGYQGFINSSLSSDESLEYGFDALYGIGQTAIICEDLPPIDALDEYEIYVLRSGLRNYSNLNVHSLTALKDPLVASNRGFADATHNIFNGSGSLYIEDVLQASAVDFNNNWLRNGSKSESDNPFTSGEMGILRPYRTLYYNDNRTQSTGQNLNKDGVYVGHHATMNTYYYPLIYPWRFFTPGDINRSADIANDADGNIVMSSGDHYSNIDNILWQASSMVTKYDELGHEVENKNALNVFSSAKFGYNGLLATAVAGNCEYNELFFENFDNESDEVDLKEFGNTAISSLIQQAVAHTGNNSLRAGNTDYSYWTSLEVKPDEKYLASAWVKADNVDSYTYDTKALTDENARGLHISFYESDEVTKSATVFHIRPTGEIIEGWQKVEAEFTVPSDVTVSKLALTFKAGNGSETTYFDDVRIYPSDGSMQSYVYDPANFRLLATLDQNNFASFYYYDSQGNLFLVKKETERGVFTLSETRSHQKETKIN